MNNQQDPASVISAAQMFLDNKMQREAEDILKANAIKVRIVNGRIVEDSDVTEQYLEQFITADNEMIQLKDHIRKLSRTQHEVLIVGETGTGKELLAQALHGKRNGIVVSLNAAGLPENLVESELFGHVRGAFTGASENKEGMITTAKNGTFFLDEVGELPLQAQAKLLRVIQHRKLRRVGGTADVEVNCRFVFATNKPIREMCNQHKFRLDLYARISTFEFYTKPLSERTNDIKLICESTEDGRSFYKALKNQQMNLSLNVRSLQQHISRYKVLGILPS